MANYTIGPNKGGGWRGKRDKASKASFIVSTKVEAEKKAKKLSSNTGGGEVRIKNKKNIIIDSDTVSPGKDPNPPKDKKH